MDQLIIIVDELPNNVSFHSFMSSLLFTKKRPQRNTFLAFDPVGFDFTLSAAKRKHKSSLCDYQAIES